MSNSLLNLHKKMLTNSISLAFKGEVDFNFIDSILEIIIERLDQIEKDLKTRRKVYGVMLECLQNICHHVEKQPEDQKSYEGLDLNAAIFMIDSDETGYNIATANFIPNSKVEKLKGWLETINSSSKDELKKLYNKTLLLADDDDAKGAGLGFLDITRKVENKLEYHFESTNDSHSFFTLELKVNRPNATA